MSEGYLKLTEKEKQTLRLLTSGHDAKSIARHLDLSVHTVNERLRDARRKLSVSSSREAARQLRAAEGHHPQLAGDNDLGEANPAEPMGHHGLPQNRRSTFRRDLWIIGGIVMSLTLAILALSSMTGAADTVSGTAQESRSTETPPQAHGQADTAAARSAIQWLEVVDAGNWAESWNATGQAFKTLNTSDKWAAVSRNVRVPLGGVQSRELVGDEFVPAPPYGYRVIRFRTSFANKTGVVETVSLSREDESWKVVGYTID